MQAFKIARGEYLMFLDSDDYWEGTTILSDLQKIIIENNPDTIFNYMSSVYPEKNCEPLHQPR